MARRVITGINPISGLDHVVIVDDAGMGAETLRRRARMTDAEVTKTTGHDRMMRQQPARGSREGTVNSKWSR